MRLRAELAVEREALRLLELRLAELERRLGMGSANSSTPPSKEPIRAKATRKAARHASQRERSKDREAGGQKSRTGRGLMPAADRTAPSGPSRRRAVCELPGRPNGPARMRARRGRRCGTPRRSPSH
nr:DUF6444 domain-containing protein [Frankia sp. Cr1]